MCNSNKEVLSKIDEKNIISEIQESNSFHNLVVENQKSKDNIMKIKVNQMNHLLHNNSLNDETKRKIMRHIDCIIELASDKNSFDHNKNKEPVNKKN